MNLFKRKVRYKFNISITTPMKKEELDKVEQDNNVKFPKKLREYWLTYGNSPIKQCIFEGKEYLTDLAAICIPTDTVLQLGRENGWLPETFYPVAHDSGGNYYCWNSEDNKIYLMFDDDIDNPFVFCNSIEDLFKLMEKCKFNA